MRKLLLLSALAAIMVLSVFPAHATHAETQTYAFSGGTAPGVSFFTTIAGNNVGGANFVNELGETPASVDVADASLQDVAFTVCQDWDGALCGEAGEPRVDVCGTSADLSTSAVPFDTTSDIVVFIKTIATTCAGSGSSGTITLTYGTVPPA